MSEGSIFFSYSKVDSEFVLNLAKDLRKAGADVWLDQLDIKPGSRWDRSIENALDAAETLLVVLSKSSVDDNDVMDEVSFALEEGMTVVPVLLEQCDIPFRIRRLQFADFSTDKKKGVQTLTRALDLDTSIAKKLAVAVEQPHATKEEVEQGKKIKEEVQEIKQERYKPYEPRLKPKDNQSKIPEKKKEKRKKNKKKKSRTPLIITIVVIMVTLAVAGYFFKDTLFPDRDEQAWQVALQQDNKTGYEFYQQMWANGKYLAVATDSINSKIEEENRLKEINAFETAINTATKDAYETYLKAYPEGPNAQKIDSLKSILTDTANLMNQDAAAWAQAEKENSFEGYLAYYQNDSIIGNYVDSALSKIEEVGKSGWIYVGRSNGTDFTSERKARVVYREGESNLSESTHPIIGDLVLATFSEGSRGVYSRSTPRDNRVGNWPTNSIAYVQDTFIEGGTLIIKIIYDD